VEAWRAKLAEGETDAAWDLFMDRYRRLIMATIRRTLGNHEELLDAFAEVCEQLAMSDLERLRSHPGDSEKSRFTTWLVAVVHNQTVDWVRRREGRPRLTPPAGLSPLQQQIFDQLLVRRRTHAEAYEIVSARAVPALSFGSFLREVADMYRTVERTRSRGVLHYLTGPASVADATPGPERTYQTRELGVRLEEALRVLRPDERLAIQLFVVDELPAAEVARLVGWPDSKSVYNRVYRALDRLRHHLERQGIGPAEL
jgi:RNA polymerase sigma factor (sigma-70 family)